MEIFLLLIIILLLSQSNSNGLIQFLISVILLGLAAYAIIWVGALALVVALIGN